MINSFFMYNRDIKERQIVICIGDYMINELFELVTGENGFLVKLRCNDFFDEEQYKKIKINLKNYN